MNQIWNSLFGNWKTTLGGAVGALGTYLVSQPGGWALLGQVFIALGFIIVGTGGKDATTGSPALPPKP